MKLRVEFVGDAYYNRRIEINDMFITKLCGQSAMNMLFEQDEDTTHKSNNFVVISHRNDLPYIAKTSGSHMSVSAFASDNFDWYCVDKEYLIEVLEGETDDKQTITIYYHIR